MYERDLEEDIDGDTSKDFRRLLISQVNASRDDSTKVDKEQAKEDAQAIWDVGLHSHNNNINSDPTPNNLTL